MREQYIKIHNLSVAKDLADFVNKESAYVLNFGYQGILSIVETLVSKNDVIVYDIDSHACIVDGVRLHVGKRFTFQHNDVESLEKNLKRAEKIVEKWIFVTSTSLHFFSLSIFIFHE